MSEWKCIIYGALKNFHTKIACSMYVDIIDNHSNTYNDVAHSRVFLGNWIFNKSPFKSFDSAHGSFLFVRGSFPLLWVPLKSICEQHFKVGAPSNSILRTGSCIFAAVPRIVMWLLEADDTPAMLQSRETIPFLVVNVFPQSSVDTGTSHKDRMASSFPL